LLCISSEAEVTMSKSLTECVRLPWFQTHGSPHAKWLAFVAAFIAFSTVTFSRNIERADTSVQQAQVLASGDVVQRHLDTGATDTYKLTIASHQFARIVVEQKGVDAILKVMASDKTLDRKVDNPNGLYGPETVSILADVATVYSIEVSASQSVPGSSYELRVEGPRKAVDADKTRVTAEAIFAEAQRSRGTRKYDEAIQHYQEAVALWGELDDKREQGYALTNAGRSYKALGKPSQALEELTKALLLLREANDTSGQAFTLNEIGGVYRDFGNQEDAITNYKQALELRLELGDQFGQAQLYNNLGLAYSNMGYQLRAVENYEISLRLWRELLARPDEMNTLVNAAKAHAEMGNLNIALSQSQSVLAYCDKELATENSFLKGSANYLKPYALTNIGLVYDTWANADEAQAKYKEALDLFRNNRNSKGEVEVLDNLGLLHVFLGDVSRGLEYFQSALILREQIKEPKGKGVTLSNIGLAHMLMQPEEALQRLELALSLSQSVRDKRFEAFTLVRIGMTYVASHDPRAALESYRKALAIQQDPKIADQRGQAITLDKMGEALALSGEAVQALEAYENALQRWTTVGDEQGRALSLYGIARVERDRHNLANARDRIEEAIRIIEKLRNRVTDRQLQMTYFASRHDLYAMAIDVRMQLYELTKSSADIEAGLWMSEQARARNLIDLLTEVHANSPSSMSPQDADKNIRLQQQISGLAQSLIRDRALGAKNDAAMVERSLVRTIQEQNELLESSRKRSSSADITQQARPLTPHEIQQLLDDNTILLQYSLDEMHSHLWTVTRSSIDHHFLAGRHDIEKAATRLEQALTAFEPTRRHGESEPDYWKRLNQPTEYYRSSALELSRIILWPVWSQLGNKRLVVVADGILQYIPFEVLPSREASTEASTNLLLSGNEIVYEPSASALALLRDVQRPSPSKTVAVFADPVFDSNDERVRPSSQDTKTIPHRSREKLLGSLRDVGDDNFTLSKLEYSLKEANAITAVAPRGSWLKVVGFKANRAAATSPLLKQFRIVHFATHGIVNNKHPELSGIVLSMVDKHGQEQEGYLTLHDIYYLDLPIDLVVLSACRTGVGKQVPGEGLIGLMRGFMHAGTQTIVVSLWDVDDEATAELMKRFYQHMLGKNLLLPAAALRQAKLEMLQHPNEKWHAPYYWAGFIVQGDWK
jgi:CHAT domain-containing protein/predicted negative regulator of RcsB-dependent stress response